MNAIFVMYSFKKVENYLNLGTSGFLPPERFTQVLLQDRTDKYRQGTVCPGSSDPPEKNIKYIFASENEVYTIFNYYDILG